MPDTNAVNVVETSRLTKVFKDFWGRPKVTAVDDLSFSIRQGEVFGLLGPNGSGKTTTIKVLLGLLHATRGQALIFGRHPRDVRIKSRVGYLPEETYLYPFLNAEETLDFYGRLFLIPQKERERRIDDLLNLVGLNIERRRPIREYSKGMARRIGIAQALINDPDLIILDEPTSGLDPIGSREVKDLILLLKERGKTVLLCTHLLADVEDVCDRIAILYGGKLRRQGTVKELLMQDQVTQLSAEGLSSDTVQKLLQLIREEEGEKPVSVDHPMTRLETFFLYVVQQAQEAQEATAGARMGTAATESFLTGGLEKPREDKLSQLLAKEDESIEEPPEEEAAPAVEQGPGELLDKLVAPETPEQGKEAPGAPEETTQKKRGPKRELLERLASDEQAGESMEERKD